MSLEDEPNPASGVTGTTKRRHPSERTSRLREAVKRAGGTRVVAERAGVPFGTLSNYLSGREMRATAMSQIAHACQVNLDWLARGEGRMALNMPGDATPDGGMIVQGPAMPIPYNDQQPPPAPRPHIHVYQAGEKLFSTLHMDRLGQCVRTTMQALEGKNATDTELGRFVALAYDNFERIDPAELFALAQRKADE